MTKKVITIIASICLVLCSSVTVLADNKTIYTEYSREEGKNDFYPKIGFSWQINYNWGFSASHQFSFKDGNDPSSYLEIRRLFLDQQLTLALSYETSDSYNTIGVNTYASFPLNDLLSYNGAVSFNSYLARGNNPWALDYSLLKLVNGINYKINNNLFVVADYEWMTYQYKINPGSTSNPNYLEIEFSTGLGYQVENFFIKGVYNWADTKYKNPNLNDNWGEFILSSNYTYKNYTFYLEYPFSEKNHIAMIGLSYTF